MFPRRPHPQIQRVMGNTCGHNFVLSVTSHFNFTAVKTCLSRLLPRPSPPQIQRVMDNTWTESCCHPCPLYAFLLQPPVRLSYWLGSGLLPASRTLSFNQDGHEEKRGEESIMAPLHSKLTLFLVSFYFLYRSSASPTFFYISAPELLLLVKKILVYRFSSHHFRGGSQRAIKRYQIIS